MTPQSSIEKIPIKLIHKWRYKLQSKIMQAGTKSLEQKKAVLSKEWNDLDENDDWMNYYFDEKGFINRDKLIF